MSSSKIKLSREDIEVDKSLAIKEGSAYFAVEGFGGQYVIPYALKLGATESQVGIIASVPYFLGSVFQLFSARLTEKVKSRKQLIAALAFTQGALLMPLFLVPLLTKSIFLLTLFFCLYIICDYMILPAWNSMIGDIIPEQERAEYFAHRYKVNLLWLVLSMITSGILLTSLSHVNVWLGFWALFTIAFFARTISVILVLMHREPRNVKFKGERVKFSHFVQKMTSTDFGNYVIFRSAFIFAIMVASPFFTVYMLNNLHFTYWQFSCVVLTSFVVRAFASPYWGRCCNQYGNRNMMFVSSMIVSSLPLIWFTLGFFFEHNPYVFFLALLAEVVGGFGWGGFELTCYNYMLQTTESGSRARMFSYFNVWFGLFHMIGGLIGAWLVSHIASMQVALGTILTVFFISFILRFGTAITLIHRVKDPKKPQPISEKDLFVEVAVRRPLYTTFHGPITAVHAIEERVERSADGSVYALEDRMNRLQDEIKKLFSIQNHALHKRHKTLKSKKHKKKK
jgi:MFS family permease